MGFCAGPIDEVKNNRAAFGTVGKFASADSLPESRCDWQKSASRR